MTDKGALSLSELIAIGDHETLRARVEADADINEEDPKSGDTALHTACSQLLKGIVQYLLEHKADPNKPHSQTGSTPLHKLVTSKLGLSTRLLLFSPPFFVPFFLTFSQLLPCAHTARNHALSSRVVEIARLLVDAGADPAIPNRAGLIPYASAVALRNHALVDVLRPPCTVDTVSVLSVFAPLVIGPRGETVERLRTKHGVSIELPPKPAHETREAAAETDADPTTVVTVVGKEENVAAAVKAINDMVAVWNARREEQLAYDKKLRSGDTMVTLPVSHEFFSRIIGTKGATVREIEKKHGVAVRIVTGDPATGVSDGVFIRGDSDGVHAASEEIMAFTVPRRPSGGARGGRGGARGGRGGLRGPRTAKQGEAPKAKPGDETTGESEKAAGGAGGARGGRGPRTAKQGEATKAEPAAETPAESEKAAGGAPEGAENGSDSPAGDEKKESRPRLSIEKRGGAQRRPSQQHPKVDRPTQRLTNAGLRFDYRLHRRDGPQTPGVAATENVPKKIIQRKPTFDDFVALQ